MEIIKPKPINALAQIKIKIRSKQFLIRFVLLSLLWVGAWFPQFILTPSHFPDTPGYISSPKQLEGYFSLSGYALRAWPTVLIFWLGDTDWQRTALQTGIYSISWSVFVLAWMRHRDNLQSFILGSLLLMFALSPRVLQWNTFLLSESLSISLVLLGAGMFRLSIPYLVKKSGVKQYFYFVLGTSFFSLAAVNRASLVPLLVLPIAFITYLLLKQKNKKVFALVLLIFTILSILYPVSYNAKTNYYWSNEDTRLSRSSFYFIYNTIEDSLQPEWGNLLWKNIQSKAPKCLEEYRASGAAPERNPYYLADLMAVNCPQAVTWLNDNFQAAFVEFFIYHPVSAVRYSFEMLGMVQDPLPYPSATISPRIFSSVFDSVYEEGYSFKPIYGFVFLVPISSIALFVMRIKFSTHLHLANMLYFVSLVSVSFTQFVIVSEPVRITTPATVMLVSSCILVIGELLSLLRVANSKQESSYPSE